MKTTAKQCKHTNKYTRRRRGGNRVVAQQRIQEWIDNNDVTAILDLSNLQLTSLPTLPTSLQILLCS